MNFKPLRSLLDELAGLQTAPCVEVPTSNTSWMAFRKQWKLYSIKPAERNARVILSISFQMWESFPDLKCGVENPWSQGILHSTHTNVVKYENPFYLRKKKAMKMALSYDLHSKEISIKVKLFLIHSLADRWEDRHHPHVCRVNMKLHSAAQRLRTAKIYVPAPLKCHW